MSIIDFVRPTTAQLEGRLTLAEGQAEDLKAEVTFHGQAARVWLSRCGVADGEPWEHTARLELREDGRWYTALEWNGDNPDDDYNVLIEE